MTADMLAAALFGAPTACFTSHGTTPVEASDLRRLANLWDARRGLVADVLHLVAFGNGSDDPSIAESTEVRLAPGVRAPDVLALGHMLALYVPELILYEPAS